MAHKIDRESFLVFSELWGATLIGVTFLASKILAADPAVTVLCASVPFACAMFRTMLHRLADLEWPRALLMPMVLTYIWILFDNVVFSKNWPIPIPRLLVGCFAIYSASLWFLLGFVKGYDKDEV